MKPPSRLLGWSNVVVPLHTAGGLLSLRGTQYAVMFVAFGLVVTGLQLKVDPAITALHWIALGVSLVVCQRVVDYMTPRIVVRDGQVEVEWRVFGYHTIAAPEACGLIGREAARMSYCPMLVLPDGFSVSLSKEQARHLAQRGVVDATYWDAEVWTRRADSRSNWEVFGHPFQEDMMRRLPVQLASAYDLPAPSGVRTWWPGFNDPKRARFLVVFFAKIRIGWLAIVAPTVLRRLTLEVPLVLLDLLRWSTLFVLLAVALLLPSPFGFLVVALVVLPAGLALSCLSSATGSLEASFGRYALWHAGPARRQG